MSEEVLDDNPMLALTPYFEPKIREHRTGRGFHRLMEYDAMLGNRVVSSRYHCRGRFCLNSRMLRHHSKLRAADISPSYHNSAHTNVGRETDDVAIPETVGAKQLTVTNNN